jgi:hypothetical protein
MAPSGAPLPARLGSLLAALLLAYAAPAAAQVDFSGQWAPVYHEDNAERIPGPELADYTGLPINDAARQFADSWDPGRIALPEEQCRVHVSPYIYRGPTNLRIWEEKHPKTQDVVALRHYHSTYEQTRTIWMDGRPHPGPNAAHTWMGFSTGRWDGDMLVIETTHLKQGWVRRNGLPMSDQAHMTEYWVRNGDLLTQIVMLFDPVYLTEPLIKSEDYVLNSNSGGNWLWPCEYVEELPGRSRYEVQSYMPGENPFVSEFAQRQKVPLPAAMGGAETMYPEYRKKLP